MYALSADTFTIRQKVTRKAASRQEHPLKTSLKIGPARPAESARKILRKNNLGPVDNFFALICSVLGKTAD